MSTRLSRVRPPRRWWWRARGDDDTRGHLAGDQLLREFARAAASSVRDVDTLARWGGEEFALALRLTPTARTATTAFFHSTGQALDDVLDDDDDAALEQVERLLTGVVAATEAHDERLRSGGAGVGRPRSP